MSGQASPSAPVRRSPKRDALVAVISTVRAKGLPKPPNAVLARLCGYATDTQVCHAIRRMVEAGRLSREDWPKNQTCDRRLWKGRT
jgi:hypothetical protein